MSSPDIAIIGMAGRFPGARSVDEFWANLRAGVESISFFTDEELLAEGVPVDVLRDRACVKARGVLQDVELFDADFFGFSPREAEITDPQHRIFLECAWEALEHAGYDTFAYPGRVGVYGGESIPSYLLFHLYPQAMQTMGGLAFRIGNRADNLATRVSYRLNLTGPSITLQTACSTSLVAVHLACQSLLAGECDMALAGGVAVCLPQRMYQRHQEGGIASPDGHCRAFDAAAQGTVAGNGAGLVVLKPLESALADRDEIHAVINGSAINNDGARKAGYTAPSVEGQSRVIAEALAMAGVAADAVTYVEAHGTGTPIGDPIEVAALTEAFRATTKRRRFCGIGSVKSNIGHLDTAAGIAGLLKTVCALEHRELPPTLHVSNPNPAIDFSSTPFYVNAELRDWRVDQGPRRAGVSSFGIGGTNAHVVVQEAPESHRAADDRPQLLVMSARTPSALAQVRAKLAEFLQHAPDEHLADIAYTLQVGRRAFEHRAAIVSATTDEAVELLSRAGTDALSGKAPAQTPSLAFLFPGQGAQRPGMASMVAHARAFRDAVDECFSLLSPPLRDRLRPLLCERSADPSRAEALTRTEFAQPALFITELALARQLEAWGITPRALIGHSVGEFVAAGFADVMSVRDALGLVVARGKLMQALPPGKMAAVALSEMSVRRALPPGLSIAAINAPDRCVVSGPADEMNAFLASLQAEAVTWRELQTSHAFHSAMVEPVLAPLRQMLARVDLRPPRLPIISTVTGEALDDATATSQEYWAQHARRTVRFADAVGTLARRDDWMLAEVGPGAALTGFARANGAHPERACALMGDPAADPYRGALSALGRLWAQGVTPSWTTLHTMGDRRRVALPTYPFERQRYWIDRPVAVGTPVQHSRQETERAVVSADVSAADHVEAAVRQVFRDVSGREVLPADVRFPELGFDSLMLMQAADGIRKRFGVDLAFRQLFEEYPDIQSLAAHLRTTAGSKSPQQPIPEVFGPWRPVARASGETLNASQREYLDRLIAKYCAKTSASKAHAARHRSTLADNRHSTGFRRAWKELVYPVVAKRAAGSRVWDVDGNEYVDLVMGYGVNLFGHAPSFIAEALREQMERGWSIGIQSDLAGQAAALVAELTRLERVCFCNTGSEAVMAALRIARAVTGRTKIAMFAGSYHGITDGVLVRKAAGGRTVPVAPGVPAAIAEDVVVLDYGDPTALDAIAEQAGTLAAVLVEPVQSSRLDLQPAEFLRSLRDITSRLAVPLVVDEMITGFRIHPAGAQGWFGIQADLATYGKIAGGGMPLGIVAGRASLMDAIDGGAWSFGNDSAPTATQTFVAGTFCKHPMAMAAAVATLTRIRDEGPALQEGLTARTTELVARLQEMVKTEEVPLGVSHFGSAFRFAPSADARYAVLLPYLLVQRGVHTWEGRTCFLSTAHTDNDIAFVEEATRASIVELRDASLLPRTARVPVSSSSAEPFVVELTEQQRGLWAAVQLSPEASSAYNESVGLRIRGAVDLDALRRTLQLIVDRHDALRATFDPDGRAMRIHPRRQVDLCVTSFNEVPSAARVDVVRDWHAGLIREPFDFASGPVIRFGLANTGDNEHLLVMIVPHLVIDGWSLDVLVGELGAAYPAMAAGRMPVLPDAVRLAPFARQEQVREEGADAGTTKSEEFWLRTFADGVPVLRLPTDRPRTRVHTYRGAVRRVTAEPDVAHAVRRFAAEQGTTPYVVLLSSFLLLMHEVSGQSDLVVGTHAAAQASLGARHLVGYWIRTIPVRSRRSGDLTGAAFLERTRAHVLEALEHQRYSIARLARALKLPPDPSRPPLVNVIFNLDRAVAKLALPGLEIERIANPVVSSRYDMLWNLVDSGEGFALASTYSAELFFEPTVARWADAFFRIAAKLVAVPNDPVHDVVRAAFEPPRTTTPRLSPIAVGRRVVVTGTGG